MFHRVIHSVRLKEELKIASAKKKSDMKIADLRQISPGVMVNDNYKPGADPALDAIIRKLKKDPKSLDSSGLGKRWKI